jgi:hypothetical protein
MLDARETRKSAMIDLHALRSPNAVKIWPAFEAIGWPSAVRSVDIVG